MKIACRNSSTCRRRVSRRSSSSWSTSSVTSAARAAMCSRVPRSRSCRPASSAAFSSKRSLQSREAFSPRIRRKTTATRVRKVEARASATATPTPARACVLRVTGVRCRASAFFGGAAPPIAWSHARQITRSPTWTAREAARSALGTVSWQRSQWYSSMLLIVGFCALRAESRDGQAREGLEAPETRDPNSRLTGWVAGVSPRHVRIGVSADAIVEGELPAVSFPSRASLRTSPSELWCGATEPGPASRRRTPPARRAARASAARRSPRRGSRRRSRAGAPPPR